MADRDYNFVVLADQLEPFGPVRKENLDLIRLIYDFSCWLETGEVITSVIGSTNNVMGYNYGGGQDWQQDYPPPPSSAAPPEWVDTYPIAVVSAVAVDGIHVHIDVAAGTPLLTYVMSFVVVGSTTGRHKQIDTLITIDQPINSKMLGSVPSDFGSDAVVNTLIVTGPGNSLTVPNGNISAGGTITAGGNIYAGTCLYLAGTEAICGQAHGTGNTVFYDNSSHAAIFSGNATTPNMRFSQTSHSFEDRSNVNYATINANGLWIDTPVGGNGRVYLGQHLAIAAGADQHVAVYDYSGNAAIILSGLGADTQTYHRQGTHSFSNRTGSVSYGYFDAAGLSVPLRGSFDNVYATSGGNAIQAPNGQIVGRALNISADANVFGGCGVYGQLGALGSGNAVIAPNGAAVIGFDITSTNGTLHINGTGASWIGGPTTINGTLQINSASASALYLPSGGLNVGGACSFNGLTVTTLQVNGNSNFNTTTFNTSSVTFTNGFTAHGTPLCDALQVNGGLSILNTSHGALGLWVQYGGIQCETTLNVGTSGSFGTDLSVSGTFLVAGTIRTNSSSSNTAIYVPNGGITVGGNIAAGAVNASGAVTAGTTGYFGTSVTINGSGTALDLPNGILNAHAGSGTTTAPGGCAVMVGGSGNAALYVWNGGIQCQYDIRVYNQGYKPGGGTWSDTSDLRTKDHVADYTTGLAAVRQIRPVTYQHNGRGGTQRDGRTFVGLVADEALLIMPEMIGRVDEKLDPDDDEPTEILTLDATALIYALVNSVKELAARVAALEA